MDNLDNVTTYFAYAAGFAVGNYVGLRVEEKLAMGMQMIRIVTGRNASELIETLREKGFGVTAVDAEGKDGPVHVIFLITKRQVAKEVISIVNNYNPKAFYSIEDVRSVNLENSSYISGATKSGSPRWMRKAGNMIKLIQSGSKGQKILNLLNHLIDVISTPYVLAWHPGQAPARGIVHTISLDHQNHLLTIHFRGTPWQFPCQICRFL